MDAGSRRRFGGLLEQVLKGLACLEPMAMCGYLAVTESEALTPDRNHLGGGDRHGTDPASPARPLVKRPQVLRRGA